MNSFTQQAPRFGGIGTKSNNSQQSFSRPAELPYNNLQGFIQNQAEADVDTSYLRPKLMMGDFKRRPLDYIEGNS